MSVASDFSVIHLHGLSIWKQMAAKRFFPGTELIMLRTPSRLPKGAVVALWGDAPAPQGLPEDARILRLEDGFLRSVGLGADLVSPMSWSIDERGIHYDATRPSDLEHLLATTPFSWNDIARAVRFRRRIVNHGLTKYNTGHSRWSRPSGNRRVILVPGQVESDAALAYGAAHVRTNLDLLRSVRLAHPDAWIVYKPHPDVLAGLRRKSMAESEAHQYCDDVVRDVSMHVLLAEVDEVHVLTSLAGFEALLRDKPVTCHGQPFYAGWGLTADLAPLARRTRRLSLDELVAGALLLYPRYVSRFSATLISPERALDELLLWRDQGRPAAPAWRRLCRPLLRWYAEMRR